MSEVEAYVDVAIMYAVVVGFFLLTLALMLPRLLPG